MARPRSDALGDRRLALRASSTLAVARARFRLMVAPVVASELGRWEGEAAQIGDPTLRTLALAKLHEEASNAKAAAMLATLAPRRRRAAVARAIVALEVLYDYLDGRSEAIDGDASRARVGPAPDAPPADGRRLFGVFIDALGESAKAAARTGAVPDTPDAAYLAELSETIRGVLADLPRAEPIAGVLRAAATRGAEAQIRAHAAARLGDAQLERWARAAGSDSGLEWRAFLAGAAASVLSLHALIAAAADPRLAPEEAAAIDYSYLPICALATLLDGVVDHARDTDSGERHYVRLYGAGELERAVLTLSREALERSRQLKSGAGQVMTLTGVLAYYMTAPGADSEFARPVIDALRAQAGRLIAPAVSLMRGWRVAKPPRVPRAVADRVRRARPGTTSPPGADTTTQG